MKQVLTLSLMILSIGLLSHKYIDWDVPKNHETKQIEYSGTIKADGLNKATIFRRIKKFIAIKDFDKVENIKCKNRTIISTKFYEKSIRYEDPEDGVIIGSGYMPVLWRRFNYLWIVYEYKIMAKDGECRYEITDFKTINFFSAPKVKSKGSGFGTGGYGYIFGSSSSTSIMSTTTIQQVKLEDYITGKGEKDSYNMQLRDNPEIFINEMNDVIKTLTNSIKEQF